MKKFLFGLACAIMFSGFVVSSMFALGTEIIVHGHGVEFGVREYGTYFCTFETDIH